MLLTCFLWCLSKTTWLYFCFQYIEASDLEEETQKENPVRYHEAWQLLCSSNGVIIPGGFGIRGLEGKIKAAQWARENKVPFLGKAC